jgi:hypothetical protein
MNNREIRLIFNNIFKRLPSFSDQAVVWFINGLFKTDHAISGTVEYLMTDYITSGYKSNMVDLLIRVNNTHMYHIEAQIKDDKTMALRMFEYGFQVGLHHKTTTDNEIYIQFPEAKVIYWEPTNSTPTQETLRFRFPNGTFHIYSVDTFKFLDHPVDELEEQKMTILLPFYLLKLRHQVATAKTSEERKLLSLEMDRIIKRLLWIVEKNRNEGLITTEDARHITDQMDLLYTQLYVEQYPEFKEGNEMLQEALKTYSEKYIEAARSAWQNEKQAWQSKEQVWQNEKQAWQNEKRHTIQTLAKMNLSMDAIAKAMNMSHEDVAKIIEEGN